MHKEIRMWRMSCVLFIFVISLFVLPFSGASPFWNPWKGSGPTFTTPGLHEVGIFPEFLSSSPCHIVAYGDINSDKFTDVFCLSSDRSILRTLIWSHEEYAFKLKGTAIVSSDIINVVAADFNYDGKLDVLLMRGNSTTEAVDLDIYVGDCSDFYKFSSLRPAAGQPIVMDANGDMMSDLFGVTYPLQTGENKTRSLWINKGNEMNVIQWPWNQDVLNPVAHLAHGFVDMNGDCVADLVVFTNHVGSDTVVAEIWLKNGGPDMFTLGRRVVVSSRVVGQISFADVNGDGHMDIVYFSDDSLHVLYRTGAGRRNEKNICGGDGDSLRFEDRIVFYFDTYDSKPTKTSVAQFGDFNLDGFPDALVVVGKGHVVLLRNEDGTIFREQRYGIGDLASINDAISASFFDVDDTGILDIIVNTKDSIRVFYNNYFLDAFFAKSLPLNGKCMEWCSSGPRFPYPKPYGVNFHGAVTALTVTDMHGDVRVLSNTQMSQSSYGLLNTPYCHFGLGRTNNYMEHFAVGFPSGKKREWAGVIPNSQLISIPNPVGDPDSWQLELFISPSALIIWVVFTLGGLILVLGIPICVLLRRERKQDEKERKQHEHLFSFNAM